MFTFCILFCPTYRVLVQLYIWQASGPVWEVPLGRRDSLTANQTLANQNLPAPTFTIDQLINSFGNQSLNITDLVALSGMKAITFNK